MKLPSFFLLRVCLLSFALVLVTSRAAYGEGPFTHTEDVLGSPHASTWLTLGAFRRDLVEDRREVGGFVVLGIPFDRTARGSRTTTSIPPATAGDGGLDLVRVGNNVTPASPPAASAEAVVELALTPRLARSCVEAAWRAGGFAGDEAALDAIVSRAHWSAVLPETRLRAIRYDDASLALDDTATDATRLHDYSGANLSLEARLTWRLDRLLYSDDEPAFERIRLEHRDARGRIATKVLEALFHWQRAMLDWRTLPASQLGTRDEADVVLRVMEAEAALDVMTDGWFAAHSRTPRAAANGNRGGNAANANRASGSL